MNKELIKFRIKIMLPYMLMMWGSMVILQALGLYDLNSRFVWIAQFWDWYYARFAFIPSMLKTYFYKSHHYNIHT